MRAVKNLTGLMFVCCLGACSGNDDTSSSDDDSDSDEMNAGDGDSTVTGDGDGAMAGDGDGDGTMAGDGDGDMPVAGDGDGDTTPISTSPTCADTADWDPVWRALEEEVLVIVNEERAAGANCGGQTFAPTHPLEMNPELQCAARLHSKDMADRDYFDHDNPSGEDPWDRIDAAGYTGNPTGENIAAGNRTAADVMEGWMDSPGHCSNIMSPDSDYFGIGYYPGGDYGHMWTQTFGR